MKIKETEISNIHELQKHKKGRKVVDRTGQRNGSLVFESIASYGGRTVLWNVRCDCGNMITIPAIQITYHDRKDCGCSRHGMSKTNTYRIWFGIKRRCFDKKEQSYQNYGGRGITICDRWMDFAKFIEDMGERPSKADIDRINNDGNYEPGNCRWISRKENSSNKRNTIHIAFNGETKTLASWSETLGISHKTLYYRKYRGWSDEEIITGLRKS